MRSVSVVLPESMWAEMPMLRSLVMSMIDQQALENWGTEEFTAGEQSERRRGATDRLTTAA
jgi:hypothetical protein